VLHSRAGDLALETDDVAPVRRLLGTGRATAAELGLDLGRRLLTHGITVRGVDEDHDSGA
jgi:hypothetical protein